METIFDFSAAPHLPLSLRHDASQPVRPEFLLRILAGTSVVAAAVRVFERDGEIFIDIAEAA